MKLYNSRKWLNKKKSSSTGSIVCYYGPDAWDKTRLDMFVEVASCTSTARLHPTTTEDVSTYKKKIKTLRDELTAYLKFLDTVS